MSQVHDGVQTSLIVFQNPPVLSWAMKSTANDVNVSAENHVTTSQLPPPALSRKTSSMSCAPASLRSASKRPTNVNPKNRNNAFADDPFQVDLDTMLNRLLSVKDDRNVKHITLRENDVVNLCHTVRKIFLEQSMLLELEGPIKICGDIHGHYTDLLRLFDLCGSPSNVNYLFLGDYVDRGRLGIETICLLFCYKCKFPNRFFLLRGNHECQAISRIYGFYDECKRRFSVRLWKVFLDVFNCLPVAAIIENQIFCCHGGLSQEFFKAEVSNPQQLRQLINSIERPTEVPDQGFFCDLLWSDPWYPTVMTEQALKQLKGWDINERGISYVFASDVVDEFLDRFGFDLIVRAHQVVEDGFEFYAGRSLVTLFSAPNYCGEFDNAGGVFCLNRSTNFNAETNTTEVDLEGSFQILMPLSVERRRGLSSLIKKTKK